MFVRGPEFFQFIAHLLERPDCELSQVFIPEISNGGGVNQTYFSKYVSDKPYALGAFRTAEPVKILYYLLRDRAVQESHTCIKRLIFGVKACDVRALQVLDRELLHGDKIDAAYKKWRESTIVISCDCETISSSCACHLTDGRPYAESGFDLNLSRVKDGYYLTIGSDAGEELVSLLRQDVQVFQATDPVKSSIDENRHAVLDILMQQNENELIDPEPDANEFWKNVCPVCYCLMLNGLSKDEMLIDAALCNVCKTHGKVRGSDDCTGCGRCLDIVENREQITRTEKQSRFTLTTTI